MDWISLSLLSAFTLGFYEISRKYSLIKATPFILLFITTSLSGLIMLPAVFTQAPLNGYQHGWIFFKSFIICFSWGGELFALRKIPLSLGMAIRSSGALLTFLLAIVFFHESPSPVQFAGITLIIFGYLQFVFLARFHRRTDSLQYRWLALMFLSTLLGVTSGGVDRHLLKTSMVSPHALQAWFSVYTPLILMIPALIFLRKQSDIKIPSFSIGMVAIPLISIFLLLSDRLYFSALSLETSSLAVVGSVRRGSIVVSVIGGGLLLREQKMRDKIGAIILIFAGLVVLKVFG